jgi:DNA-binding PucR family transcriptional regulator
MTASSTSPDVPDLERIVAATVGAVAGGDEGSLQALRDAFAGSARARVLPTVESARQEVEGLRRRAGELSVLYSSARELAGVRDADAVLVRLVERAHAMLGADITYLSEFDPASRELRVRTTYGSVSAAFRELVVPPGRGLVSAIAETRMPQAVSRYRDYAAERHDAVIDDAVAAEGIVSLVGVPLRTETAVLGVLFVAMRQERVFTPEQVALLSALADHASVVLQTADTLKSLRRSEEETRATLAELTAHLTQRDRANTVHQQLVHAVLGGGGFAPVAATLATTLDRPIRIVDDAGRERASSGDTTALRAAWDTDAVRRAVELSRGSGRAAVAASDAGPVTVVALTAGARLFGAVLADRGAFDLGPVDLRTLERAGQVCALLALSEEAADAAARRQQIDLLADLVTAVPERRADAAARARRHGVDVDRLDVVACVVVPGERRGDAARALARAVGSAGLVGELDGVIAVAAESSAAAAQPAALQRAAVDAVGAPVLVMTAPASGRGLAARFDDAQRAVRLAAALGADAGVVTTDELLPYAAVLDADQRALAAFLDAVIGPVRRYDADRGTELLATLRAFVRFGGSPTRVARALTFHPNTILQRLERLEQVLGAGWRDDERFFRISLAVRLDELRERVTRVS